MKIDRIYTGLFRILVPFEDLTTTVYVARLREGVAIIDSSSSPSDCDEYVVPALSELGIEPCEVKWLLLTHGHRDHSGGLCRLCRLFPGATVGAFSELDIPGYTPIRDGDLIGGELLVLHLPGHTRDSLGFFDTRSRTLLSGDSLQLLGIGKYRNGIGYPRLYVASVKKLMKMDIHRIVAAHEYDPLGSVAEGHEAVLRYLELCIDHCPTY